MQISYESISLFKGCGRHGEDVYSFFDDLIESCAPVFDDCPTNYEVEDKLRKAKVIHDRNNTDSESGGFGICFSSRKSGEKFIDRLNKYLQEHENGSNG